MPHKRTRILHASLRDALGWSPAVGVVGLRQVGKTTALGDFAKSVFSFDDVQLLDRFKESGQQTLLESESPILLDEVQKYPPVFDLLKLLIDQNRKPGRYLLTGSVRFNSKRAIRESLTGRLVTWEMLPLTLSETHQKTFSKTILNIAKLTDPKKLLKQLENHQWSHDSDLEKYLKHGGMPGVCFLRSEKQRIVATQGLLESFLLRDVQLVRPLQVGTTVIRGLFRLICVGQGMPANHSAWARELGTSVPTVQRLIEVFSALFLIRVHGKTYFAEDQGLGSSAAEMGRPVTRFVYGELKAQSLYRPELRLELSEFHTRGGAFVPFVLDSPVLGKIGIAVSETDQVTEKIRASLISFRKRFGNARLVAIHRGKEPSVLGSQPILALPWTWLG